MGFHSCHQFLTEVKLESELFKMKSIFLELLVFIRATLTWMAELTNADGLGGLLCKLKT